MTESSADRPCHWDPEDWLAASSRGLWRGRPGSTWQMLGPYELSFHCLHRGENEVVAGGDSGLWQAVSGERLWRQLHDEVLAMVQDVAPVPGQTGWLAATAYGVHAAVVGDHGALRWRPLVDGLANRNARFTTRLLALEPADRGWLVATEDGLWITDRACRQWRRTAIAGTAVRALLRGQRGLWAGTDAGGLWHSDDGDGWSELVGAGPGEPLLALAELPEGGLLAGTTTGAVRGDGSGSWERLGPPTAVISLAVSREQQGLWAFGASPGGLWWTDDGGARWTQVIEVPGGVGSVLAP